MLKQKIEFQDFCSTFDEVVKELNDQVKKQAQQKVLKSEIKQKDIHEYLKVMSATFLLVCFLRLKESTFETRKNVFYFTSKALSVLEIIKF